jgi:hypothetical protein
MKSFSKLAAFACAFALACAFFAPNAAAQAGPAVMTKQVTPKPVWLKVKVVHFDENSMTVRVLGDEMRILTFTFANNAQPQVQKALDEGGYQYDDQLKIRYVPGTSVVLAIHGKASKSKPSSPRKPTSPLRTHPTPQ